MSVLRIEGVSKSFPGVLALDNVSMEINRGEIVALVGQNGAGKSTLSDLVYGAIEPDKGEIIIDDKNVKNITPKLAQSLGVIKMFQECVLIPQLSLSENVFLGHEKTRGIIKIVNFRDQYIDCKEIQNKLGINLEINKKVNELSMGEQRLIEIIRACSFKKPLLIIMDEPTTAINKSEKENLFKVLKRLKEMGSSILYISHYLDEVFQIADRIAVLKDGKLVSELEVNNKLRVEDIVFLMTGGVSSNVKRQEDYESIKKNKVVLNVVSITKNKIFKNISFTLRKGEILGLGGLIEAGQKDILRAIFGFIKYDEGSIFINESKVNIYSPIVAIKNGIGYIPEDRNLESIFPNLNIRENMTLQILKRVMNFIGFIDRKKEEEIIFEYIKKFEIVLPSIDSKFINLSGGNKQKAILARWLMSNTKILMINEPTRGVDVKSRVQIHEQLLEMAKRGISILLVSSELDELCNLCHRIIIIKKGQIEKEIISENITQHKLLEYITEG